MQEKGKKVLNTVVNVIVTVILVMVVFITINIILSGNKGYTTFFGSSYIAVQTDSMKGDGKDNFSAGDLIRIKILSDEEKKNLQPGDVVTFYDIIEGTRQLNTHRIVRINNTMDNIVYYVTKGDNNPSEDESLRPILL